MPPDPHLTSSGSKKAWFCGWPSVVSSSSSHGDLYTEDPTLYILVLGDHALTSSLGQSNHGDFGNIWRCHHSDHHSHCDLRAHGEKVRPPSLLCLLSPLPPGAHLGSWVLTDLPLSSSLPGWRLTSEDLEVLELGVKCHIGCNLEGLGRRSYQFQSPSLSYIQVVTIAAPPYHGPLHPRCLKPQECMTGLLQRKAVVSDDRLQLACCLGWVSCGCSRWVDTGWQESVIYGHRPPCSLRP